ATDPRQLARERRGRGSHAGAWEPSWNSTAATDPLQPARDRRKPGSHAGAWEPSEDVLCPPPAKRRYRSGGAGLPIGEVGGQLLNLVVVQAQAQLAATPKNVVRAAGPFPAAQVVDFSLIQAGAEMLAEVFKAGGVVDDFAHTGAVAIDQSRGQCCRYKRMAAGQFCHQLLRLAFVAAGQRMALSGPCALVVAQRRCDLVDCIFGQTPERGQFAA